MLSRGGPHLQWGAAQTERTDETKWRMLVYIFLANTDACILPAFHFIISITFFPHQLWASVEITGEISVCGRVCLSSRGSRGKGEGFERGGDCEGEEKKRIVLCSTAVLFVERTLPFVCLTITYSAQGHLSRGRAQASIKTENNEATAAQRIAFSLRLGRPPSPPTPPPPSPSPPPSSLPLSANLNR